ncbi:MAG: pentapeptide repeat-containing protein [Erythrobacter sp.]|nr:pentapeptide repeat-containing protein [Erythrobacter sp.]
MLSGLIVPAAAVVMALEPEPASPEPVSPRILEHLSSCKRDGESVEQFRDAVTIINADGVYRVSTLVRFIQEADGDRLVINGGDFSGEDMRVVAPLLSGSCLFGTRLHDTEWSGSEIANLQLQRVELRRVKAVRVKWRDARMHGVHFEESDFTGSDLTGLRFQSGFQGSNFRNVSFRNAELNGAIFACGITSDVWCINAEPDLRGANLTNADMSGLGLWDMTRNEGAILSGTTVAPRSLRFLSSAEIRAPIRLATYYHSPYDLDEDRRPSVRISAEEARILIDKTLIEVADEERDVPSFDCAAAATSVEELICGEYESELRRLDRQLADSWSRVRAAGKGSLAAQRRWLLSRADCEGRTCLTEKYELRIAEMRGLLGPGIALAPDQSVTYHADILPLPDTMRSTELYRRILPVLVNASYQSITLTGLEDGSVAAEGDAVGANAHLCGMLVPSASFDPETGWWTVKRSAYDKPVQLFRVEGRKLIMRYSGNYGNTPEEAADLLSCGARAGFTDGIDLAPG